MRAVPAALLAAALTAWCGAPAGAAQVRVTGDRVNLRARPAATGEIVGQASKGEIFAAGKSTGEWLQVVPPSRVDLWLHADLVKEDRVAGREVNVRAGPGLNYPPVCRLRLGARLEVRGTFGDWIKIAPPAASRIWISRRYTAPHPPPRKPAPARATKPEPKPKPRPPAAVPAREPAPPAREPLPREPTVVRSGAPDPALAPAMDGRELVPSKQQGARTSYRGVLRATGWLWRHPRKFRLTHRTPDGVLETVCYVRAARKRIKPMIGHAVRVEGREYWLQGIRHPVLVPERMVRQD